MSEQINKLNLECDRIQCEIDELHNCLALPNLSPQPVLLYTRKLMELRSQKFKLTEQIKELMIPVARALAIAEPFKNKPRRIIRANKYYQY